ncbi:MAG: CRISPR-associated helicase Cas3' [Nitrososphaeria archaeon]
MKISTNDDFIKLVEKETQKPLRYWQRKSIERILDNLIEGREKIILIDLPTGYGKTLIGLSPLIYQIKTSSWKFASWLCYILPTRVLCDSLALKIAKEYLKNLVSEESIRTFHGNIEDASELFSPMVAVTTFDTFLLSYARRTYGGIHIEKPAGFIATSYLVFDESHMINDEYLYSFSLLKAVMERLVSVGTPILFMTATLPSKIKDFLFDKNVEIESIPGPSDKFNEEIESYRGKIVNANFTSDHIEKILENEKFCKRLIIVSNTVEKAAKVYERLSDNVLKLLIHSRLAKKERIKRENAIRKFLGQRDFNVCDECGEKNEVYYYENIDDEQYRILCASCAKKTKGKVYEKIVVSATQVIEAGLDVSSDVLITDLAPADALVQRSGRCARFKGEEGKIYIVDVDSPAPYPDSLIQKTREEVRKRSSNGTLATSLVDYNYIQEFVDNSYEEFKPAEYERKMELEDTISYLQDQLLSFTVNWKMIDRIRTRPESQITVIAPAIYEVACVKGRMETKRLQRYEFIDGWFKKDLKNILDEVLRVEERFLVISADDVKDNAFTVSIGKLRSAPSFLSFNNHVFTLHPLIINKKKVYLIKGIEAVKFKLEEGVYLVNPSCYSEKNGLVKLE